MAQVALMGAIYAQAAGVLVWLGSETNDSDCAMNIMRDLGSRVKVDWNNYAVSSSQDARESTVANLGVALAYDAASMRALSHLFDRDWFDRLWIRQEIFLAKQNSAIVQCGRITVHWELFRGAWLVIRRKPWENLEQHLEDRLTSFDGILFQYPETGLEMLRQDFGFAKCQEPHDRIYAVRALLPEKLRAAIKPNYTRPLIDTYREAVLAHLEVVGNLDILGQCQFSDTWTGPSWIPDWSSDEGHPGLPLDLRMASGMIKTPWETNEYMTMLKVTGVTATTLSEIRPLLPLPAWKNNFECISRVISPLLAEENRALSEKYPAGGTLLDAYTRTLCNDVFNDNHDVPTGRQFPCYEIAKQQIQQLKSNTIKQHPIENWELGKLQRRISYSCSGRLFMRTENDLIGLAPHSAKRGDQVCTLFGSRKLFILRPLRGQRYSVVGEWYLCGFSHGEAILGPLPEHIQPIWASVNSVVHAEVFQDDRIGDRKREDPRLSGLGLDITSYLERLRTETRPYLEVDLEQLRALPLPTGFFVKDFELV